MLRRKCGGKHELPFIMSRPNNYYGSRFFCTQVILCFLLLGCGANKLPQSAQEPAKIEFQEEPECRQDKIKKVESSVPVGCKIYRPRYPKKMNHIMVSTLNRYYPNWQRLSVRCYGKKLRYNVRLGESLLYCEVSALEKGKEFRPQASDSLFKRYLIWEKKMYIVKVQETFKEE